MKRLLIRQSDCDAETRRVSDLLSRDAELTELRQIHPARLIADALRLRRSVAPGTVIHAFGLPSVAAAMGVRAGKLIFSPADFPTVRQAAWVRAIASYREIQIICSSDTMRRQFVTRGVASDRCHLVRPGIKMSTVPTQRNRELRAKFGFTDTETVLLAPLEITHTSGHGLACWALSILQIVQPQYRLLVWGRGASRATMTDFKNRLLDPRVTTVATDIDPSIEVEQLFSAADGVLLTPTGPVSPLITAMAMASGRPIIATITQQLCELLEDRHTAILINQASPKVVAQKIIDLFSDPTLTWQLQDRARAEAYDLLTVSKFMQTCHAVYAKVDGARHSSDSPIFSNPIEA